MTRGKHMITFTASSPVGGPPAAKASCQVNRSHQTVPDNVFQSFHFLIVDDGPREGRGAPESQTMSDLFRHLHGVALRHAEKCPVVRAGL